MRYLHVIPSLNPADGGPVEAAWVACEQSLLFGHQVELACLDAPDAVWHAAPDFTVHRLGPARLGRYAYAPEFKRWLRTQASRFDAVIVHGIWQYHSLATRAALRGSGVPYFIYPHGMLDPWFKRRYPLKHAKKWLYWPWADYRVLRDARAVLFTCEEERVLARQSFRLYRASECVVNYGIPIPDGEPMRQRRAFLEAYPALHGRRILLFMSRIHPKKGCDLAIRAFATVAREQPDLQLVMAGPDQLGWRRSLEELATSLGVADRITWTGMLQGDVKWGAYHAAEAFVLPSHSENFGIVVAEALACGVPVLITDKVNIWREIAAARAGIIASDTLEDTIATWRTWLGLSDDTRRSMVARATTLFRESFHIVAATRSQLAAINARCDQQEPAVIAASAP